MRRIVKEAGLRGQLVTALTVCAVLLAVPASALALPYREIVEPPSGQSKGIVVLIHGGGWAQGEIYTTATAMTMGPRLAAAGFTVWSVDHANGAASLPDVKAWYELARQEANGKPVCTAGQSTGGHLALMLAGLYPTVKCVIAEAAPTNLETLTPPGVQNSEIVWGAGNLPANSPVHNLPPASTEVFLAASDWDNVIPSTQATEYKAVRPQNTSVMMMPYGTASLFVHTYTTAAGAAELEAAEQAVLARAAGDDDPGGGGGSELLTVGKPIKDTDRGVIKIPAKAGVAGNLHLSGRGVVSREKSVDAGEQVKLKVRPRGGVARKLRKKDKATATVEVALTGAGKPASETLDVKFRQR